MRKVAKISIDQRAALRAVKQVPRIVSDVASFCSSFSINRRKQASLIRHIRRHGDIIAATFLPYPLQEALEQSHEALVACRLVVENYKALTEERRKELISNATIIANSAVKLVEVGLRKKGGEEG